MRRITWGWGGGISESVDVVGIAPALDGGYVPPLHVSIFYRCGGRYDHFFFLLALIRWVWLPTLSCLGLVALANRAGRSSSEVGRYKCVEAHPNAHSTAGSSE